MHGVKNFSRIKLLILFLILFATVPLAYCLYTGHMWEDFFITFKFSKNFCDGEGLVYTPGEKVHGFTSPLGVILPAFCYLVTGSDSYEKAVWLFRIIFCIPAFVAAGYFMISVFLSEDTDHKMIPVVFAGLLFTSEAKSVVFSVNGMETALMLFFLAWAFYLMSRDKFSWLNVGVAWGGLMWTRPDSCVYIAALTVSFLAFRKNSTLKGMIAPVLKAAAVTTVIYLPWFIWSWWYYGSPVPHTVLAKNAMNGPIDLLGVVMQILTHLFKAASWVYAPVYPHFAGWNPIIYIFSGSAGIFASVYWLLPWARGDRLGRIASLAFFIVMIYFASLPFPYPWYFPPAAILGIIVFVRGFFTLSGHFKTQENRFTVPVIALSGFFLVMMTTLLLTSYEMMLQQKYIENGTRKKIGEWLGANTRKDDRIYLEALGYIGYFSDRKMLDYPGLVSPEVVELVKKERLNYFTLIERLRPEWVVVRILEHWNLITQSAYFKKNYEVVIIFDSTDALGNLGYIPGEGYLLYDSYYYISRRRNDGDPVIMERKLPQMKKDRKNGEGSVTTQVVPDVK